MKITRITCMPDGASVFEDVEIELTPSGPIGSLSKPYPVSSVLFRETPPDYDFNWHPAPHRQYIVLLDGEIEIETGMSEKRQFRAGDILLLEDRFDPRNTYALGYSNGANLATGLLLLNPDALAGAVLLRPMFVSHADGKPKLTGKSVLINFGRHDPFLGDGDMERLPAQFRSSGANVEVHIEETGHGLGPGDLQVVKAWLENRETI